MLFYFYILVFFIAFIALGVSSGLVARSFLKLSRVVGINEWVLSFIMLGAITSLPEIFIAVASIITNSPIISVSNIIGSNFVNISLAIGLVAYISDGIELSRQVSKRVFWLSFILAILPAFLILGGGINRFDGIILLLMFVGYLIVFSYDSEFIEKSAQHVPYGAHYFSDIFPALSDLFMGLTILIASSIFIVMFTAGLAGYLSMNLILFSMVFLGLATALPELFFGMRGALVRHPSLAMGNILAAAVFNSTVIVGFVSIISQPIVTAVSGNMIYLSSAFSLAAFVLLSIFSYTSSKISRLEGTLLISLYLLFFVSIFLI